jgi:hypothetical protein
MDISETIDQERWLMNNGLFSTNSKNNIYMYGALCHREIVAVDVAIESSNKTINYSLYCKSSLLKSIDTYNNLKHNKDFWSLFKLRSLLKKQGNLNISLILNNFIHDYCGPDWNVIIVLKDEKEYIHESDTETTKQ